MRPSLKACVAEACLGNGRANASYAASLGRAGIAAVTASVLDFAVCTVNQQFCVLSVHLTGEEFARVTCYTTRFGI